MDLLTTVCILVLIVFTTALYFKYNKKLWGSFDDVTADGTPWNIPFFGHALALQGPRDEVFMKLTRLTLKIAVPQKVKMTHIKLGPIPVIFIICPVVAAKVLRSTKMIKKSYLYSFLHSWLGTGLLTGWGDKWKLRRRMIEPAFHSSVLQSFLGVMNEQAQLFVSLHQNKAEGGQEFDIFGPITSLSLDIICETAMGKGLSAQRNQNIEYIKAIQGVNAIIQDRQRAPWIWPEYIFKWSPSGKQYFKHLSVLHNFTRSVLNARISEYNAEELISQRRLAFLDMLLKEEQKGNITREGIEEEVDTFMFAGHDTTATAISWALHLLGHHEDVQQKLYEELHSIFGDDTERDVTIDDLREMTYMELVIKESLRMFPSVPIIGRTIEAECILDGRKIPSGTECLILTHVINNNKNFWKEPERFDPERFRPENSIGRHPFTYLPFSAGPRNCIGQRFALMEEKVVICHILRNYSIESTEATKDLRLLGDIILRSKSGIMVKLKRRCS